MNQGNIWEKEYSSLKLVTGSSEPQNDFKRFVKWLKKDQKVTLEGLRVLDLGSGLGKNSIFLAERGAEVVGMEISKKAIEIARKRAGEADLTVKFINADIGVEYEFPNNSFDLVLDIMSSNSLDEHGREVYVREVYRVLKPGGYLFVRTLARDGDKNAENLLAKFPGKEKDTYIMPDLGLTERVFTKQDFEHTFLKYFSNVELLKKSGYAQVGGKPYKRNYWLAYLQKAK